MKKFAIALLAVVLLVSCPESSTKEPSGDLNLDNISVNMSDKYEIDSSSTITITNLEEGALYGIFPSSSSERSRTIRTTNPQLVETDAGSYLHVASSSSLSFKGSDIGIGNSGNVRFIKYDTSENNVINSEEDEPLYTKDDGSEVYEEYYKVDLDDLVQKEGLNKSRVVLIDKSYSRNASQSTWYGIVDGNTLKASKEDSLNGVMDLSSSSTINIINQVTLRRGTTQREILVKSPITLELGAATDIKPHQPYEVKKGTGKDLVLEINIGENDIRDYGFSSNVVDGRYSTEKPGWRKNYIFPISYDKSTNTALLYLGESDEDYFFFLQMTDKEKDYGSIGSGKIREITDEEKALINIVNVEDGGQSAPITSSNCFIPIIFEGAEDLNALSVKAYISGSSSFLSLHSAPYKGGRGYAGQTIRDTEVVTLSESRVLEHAFLLNYDGLKTSIVLQFSKDKDFPTTSLIKEDVIDFKDIEDKSEPYSDLGTWDRFSISGFKEGYLYGFYVNNATNTPSNTNDIYHLFDNIYIFRPSSFEDTISLNGINYGPELVFFKVAPGDDSFSTSNNSPILTRTIDGNTYDYYLHYAKLDTSRLDRSSIYAFANREGSIEDNIRRLIISNDGITIGYEGDKLSLESGDNLYAFMLFSKLQNEIDEVTTDFYACNPTKIELEEETPSSFPVLLSLDANSSEIVLELNLSNVESTSLLDFISSIKFIYDLKGDEKVYAFPISYENNILTLYVGDVPKGANFAIIGDGNIKAKARLATDDDKALISPIDLNGSTNEDLTVNSTSLLPIVFKAESSSLIGKKLSLTFEDNQRVYYWYNSKNRESKGSSKGVREWDLKDDTIPEFLTLWSESEDISVTLTVN